MGLSDDLYESFILYQRGIAKEFRLMESKYGIARIDGGRGIPEVNAELQKRIDAYLKASR